MRKITEIIFASGLALAVLISNIGSFMRDGRDLDRLRGKVLRLHILANSDSEEDQRLKLTVRDELLKSGILDGAEDLGEAEAIAQEKLPEIVELAEETLRENGCDSNVTAELADVEFDKRVYGDITMPAGTYRALRIKIGAAQGHNWWCVLYPGLCFPDPDPVVKETSSKGYSLVFETAPRPELHLGLLDAAKQLFKQKA